MKKNNKICLPNYDPHPLPPIPPQTHIMGKIMGFSGLQDGCQWKCSNSAKIWAGNYWYHTQCVSRRLDKTDFLKNCWKKINYFPREVGRGGWRVPLHDKFHGNNNFFFEAFPNTHTNYFFLLSLNCSTLNNGDIL